MFQAQEWSDRPARLACAWAPAAVTLLGAGLLLLVGNLRLPAGLAATALLAAGAATMRLTMRRAAGVPTALPLPEPQERLRVAERCAVAAPVWVRQIESARASGDTEVAQLCRVFADMVTQLDRVMDPGHSQQHVLAALARQREELQDLVGVLRSLQESKQAMVDDIGRASARLKSSAAEMREVALLTRMVSLNATIEAARAGEAGKPFGVVVGDMRELAARTASATEQFSRDTDALHAMVGAAFQEHAAGAPGAGRGSIAWAQQLVTEVAEHGERLIAQWNDSVAALGEERQQVRADISRVLVSLQFQDRVSQILAHVADNLRDLLSEEAPDAAAAADADAAAWLQRMTHAYSTPEEFGNLQASPPLPGQRNEAITYF